jgi:hypothetical protein
MSPRAKIPDVLIEEFKDFAITEPFRYVLPYILKTPDELRDLLLTHPEMLKDPVNMFMTIRQNFHKLTYTKDISNFHKFFPRWEAFEKFILNLPEEDLRDEEVLKGILRYLSTTENFGRWEEIDYLFLDMQKDTSWLVNMFWYLKNNNVKNNLKWLEFEKEIITYVYDCALEPRIAKQELNMSLHLAVTYWRSVSPKGSRWKILEPKLLEYGYNNYMNIETLVGGSQPPVERYKEHTGLREIEMRRR